jgi:hypothetical protein
VRPTAALGISVEMIDARTLLPFDRDAPHRGKPEEDQPPAGGGRGRARRRQRLHPATDPAKCKAATAGWTARPCTLTAKAHRPAYGSDGDYFSKPSVEDVVEKVVGMVRE